jgi:16S rRNA (uracil1498-N3)-methyltransferase
MGLFDFQKKRLWSGGMRRFMVEEIEFKDGLCSITGSEARHIAKVLRMQPDDALILMDAKGSRFQVIIKAVTSKEVLVTLHKPIPAPPPSPVKITLCQALLKSRAMDYVVQKTSELGVDRFFPFFSERTVVTLNEERSENKMRHWREIAYSAAKQSDRFAPAEIPAPSSFKELVAHWQEEDALKVIMWEGEGAKDLKGLLRATPPLERFIGVVGPEGGFARPEIGWAREAGFASVSLGNRILRAETAAITMVAIVQYEWGDLSLNG